MTQSTFESNATERFEVPNASPFVRDLANAQDIPELVKSLASRMPDKPFLILELANREPLIMSYGQLVARANVYAALYIERRLKRGALVVLMLVAHPDLAPAFLGAMAAGLLPTIFPPITQRADPSLFYATQRRIFSEIGAAMILTERRYADGFKEHMLGLAESLQIVEEVEEKPSVVPWASTPSRVAFLQHSSGTTGDKKGVVLTHRAVLDFVASLATALHAEQDDVIASWLPLYHDMGLIGCLILPMVLGLTVVQLDPFEWVSRPVSLLNSIKHHRATLCWMPNFAFHHTMRAVPEATGVDLSSMRAFIDCSEPCKPETLRLFRKHFSVAGLKPTALQVSYGMAENVFIATQTSIRALPVTVMAELASFSVGGVIRPPIGREPALEFLSVGTCIPGTRLRIVAEDGGTLPDRQVGQIAVASPYLFTGYFQRESPVATLVDGWYLSGDLGFTINGELFVCGRIDDLLIINGRNLYAHDVEYAINRQTDVKPGRCVVVAPFNDRLGSQALVVIAETTKLTLSDRHALARQIRDVVMTLFGIATYDVRVVGLGWMVKTTSGKVSRKDNVTKYLDAFPFG